ncbi:MAG: ROK family protein [Acidimicrobiia bacterium]
MTTIYGTVELGGTKTKCAIGDETGQLSEILTIPTESPESTLAAVIGHLGSHDVGAVGVACFGPVELRSEHPDYGHVTRTPKSGWSGADVVGALESGLDVPVAFDTDVNGAALGESRWGAGMGYDPLVYVTVGTGIGGGLVVEGRPHHGLVHPEMGHMNAIRDPEDPFPGSCPFHGDCVEGLASGLAIERRSGAAAASLSGEALGEAIRLEVFYLAQLVRNIVYAIAPSRIVIGGGVMKLPGLFEALVEAVPTELAGYPGLPEHREGFLARPGLGDRSGLAGGVALALAETGH